MADTQIIITDYDHDQKTGHISVRVKSRTKDGNATWDGPERTYGCDAVMFRSRFNSDIAQFEAWVVHQHKANEGAHKELTQALLARKGKVIG